MPEHSLDQAATAQFDAVKQPEPAAPDQADSVVKALCRTANPAHAAGLISRALHCFKTRGAEATFREASYRVDLMKNGTSWKFRADLPLKRELAEQRKVVFDRMPFFSILVPLYNTPIPYLKAMIKSVLKQSYTNFELILLDASGPAYQSVSEAVKRFSDRRIVLCKLAKNGGIAANTTIGFREASGDYITLLDHDDTLAPNALYEMAYAINERGADFLYSDEIIMNDTMSEALSYHFKPDFSPDTLRGCNYITHLTAFSAELLNEIGGEELSAYNGAQDYDLILRLTEKAKSIVHIPKVLYFWRSHADSTASDISAKPYAIEAGACAVRAQLERMGISGGVSALTKHPGAYRVVYNLKEKPMVSVIIPSMDHIEDLKKCLDALYRRASYENFEVIVVENNSSDKKTFQFYNAARQYYPNLRFVRYQGAFNYSAINNYGVKFARGEHLLLLNNDVELLSENFMREMLGYSVRADIGAVGAKLFYPDNTIQHAGIFIGLGGSAGVNHKGHPRESGGDMYRLATTQNVNAVTGACLMVKKSLYAALGGLDDKNFAVAYNDVDFCLRLREKGLLNVMTPFAYARHSESKSRGDDTHGNTPERQRYEKEKATFCAKYAQILTKGDEYYNPHLTTLYENYGLK